MRGISPTLFCQREPARKYNLRKSVWWREAPKLLLRSALWKHTPFQNKSKPRAPGGCRAFWTAVSLRVAPHSTLWEEAAWSAVRPWLSRGLSPPDFLSAERLVGPDLRKDHWVLAPPHTHCLASHAPLFVVAVIVVIFVGVSFPVHPPSGRKQSLVQDCASQAWRLWFMMAKGTSLGVREN